MAAAHAAPASAAAGSAGAGAVELPPVVASTSRLAAGLSSSSVTIVDRETIARHPGMTVPEILAREAGVNVIDLFGSGDEAASVDIRGFGEQAAQNTLVLVDGRRINDLDLSAARFSLVPRGSIQRIEVLRGAAASVLYGEGGVGGAINIVTQGGPRAGADVSSAGTVGSFGFRRLQGSFGWGGEQAQASLFADAVRSDGYRQNNELRRQTYAAAMGLSHAGTDLRFGATYSARKTGLPGSRIVDSDLGIDQLATDRSGTQTPDDRAKEYGLLLEAGAETQLSTRLRLYVDAGYRRSITSSDFVSGFLLDDRNIATSSLTPRATFAGTVAGRQVNAVTGLDLSHTRAEVDQRFIGFAGGTDFDGVQTSAALYGQADVALADALTLDLGTRLIHTRVKLDSRQAPQADLRDNEFHVAANLGLALDLNDNVQLFARGGHAVRLPTIDERVGTKLDPATFLPVSFDLETQTSWDVETGAEMAFGRLRARLAAFQIDVRNQIAFTPDTLGTFGYNTNLDPTRRRGIEADGTVDLGSGFTLAPRLGLVAAEFVAGPFDGNALPLVPGATAGLGLGWTGESAWASATWRYVGEQRMINDQAATFPEIPAYNVLDIAAGTAVGAFAIRGELRNALDEEYYAVAAASDTNPDRYGAFPLPGRAAYVELAIAF